MPPDTKTPWFLTPLAVIIAILCAGPLALPLVWMSPAFKRWQRWLITALVVILSIWILKASADLYGMLLKEMQALQSAMR